MGSGWLFACWSGCFGALASVFTKLASGPTEENFVGQVIGRERRDAEG